MAVDFQIGKYFTVGFHQSLGSFIVYSIQPETIRQLEDEARRPKNDRELMVAGIVGKERPYNSPWSYTLSPPTVEADNEFGQSCNAGPNQVERNVDEWRGKRWCPRRSYVKQQGR